MIDASQRFSPLRPCRSCGVSARVYRDGSRRRCRCGADPLATPVAALIA